MGYRNNRECMVKEVISPLFHRISLEISMFHHHFWTSQEFVQTMNTVENIIVYVSLTLISCGIRYRTNLFIVVPLNCIHIKYQSQLNIFLNLIKL